MHWLSSEHEINPNDAGCSAVDPLLCLPVCRSTRAPHQRGTLSGLQSASPSHTQITSTCTCSFHGDWLFLSIVGAGQCRCEVVWGPAGSLFGHWFVPTQSLGFNPERWFIVGKFVCEKPLISHSERGACWHVLSAWIIIPIHVRASAGGIHLLLGNSQSSQHASLWSKCSSPLLWTAFGVHWRNNSLIGSYVHNFIKYFHNQRHTGYIHR